LIEEIRCKKCGKKLGEKLSGDVEIVCPRCQTFNAFREADLTIKFVCAYSIDNTKSN